MGWSGRPLVPGRETHPPPPFWIFSLLWVQSYVLAFISPPRAAAGAAGARIREPLQNSN